MAWQWENVRGVGFRGLGFRVKGFRGLGFSTWLSISDGGKNLRGPTAQPLENLQLSKA